MKSKTGLVLIILTFPILAYAQLTRETKKIIHHTSNPVYNIIPKPVSVKLIANKAVNINSASVIFFDPLFSAQAMYLNEMIFDQCALRLKKLPAPFSKRNSSVIILKYDSTEIDRPEMYVLVIRNNQIMIKAKDIDGMVHGIQTLMQLFPLNSIATTTIPSVTIKDYPRFRYRGMHLDVSRHFFPVNFIKKYIDYLAFHKFNTFHWHLTDDQGWRIEIKSYPKLTEIGAWRNATLIGHIKDKPARYDSTRYGGYYTQQQVKDIINYAAIRAITIIPEIDIPGHSRAIIASYPELSTKPDTDWKVATAWGMYNRENNVLAPNEKTFAFLKTVFGEICDLFPSPYMHIGGDECSKIWWKADSKTQAFIKGHNLKDESGLQTYFIQQVEKYVKAKGKKIIGWDEVLEGDLDTSTIIMNWRGNNAAIDAAQKGHDVIMTPGKPLYFDNYQSKDKNDSLAIHGYTPLDAVYNYDPLLGELASPKFSDHVLGAQGNVWTEYMSNISKVEYMIFPRMTALSESLWTQSKEKDFIDFKRRLIENAIPRYHFLNCNYFRNYEYWTSDK
jgi:hexosaminidase